MTSGTVSSSPTVEKQALKFKAEERRLSDNVYTLLDEPRPDVEVVLFHGVQMEGSDAANAFWRTWKMRNSEECWPEVLLPQLLVERDDSGVIKEEYKARVLSVSYEARPDLRADGNGNESSDENLIAECLLHELILSDGGVAQKADVPVFLVGHDLGGILIKHFVMLVENRAATESDEAQQTKLCNFLKSLKSVFFYATPQSGSEVLGELTKARVKDEDTNQMLSLLRVLNKDTSRINELFRQYRRGQSIAKGSGFTSHAVHPLHETLVRGRYVNVVVEGSTRQDVDFFYSADADHFEVCQPKDGSTTAILHLSKEMIAEVQNARNER